MASLFVIVLLAMSNVMPEYATSIRQFEPIEGAFFRLEGNLKQTKLSKENNGERLAVLCDENACVQAVIPVMYVPRLKIDDRIIVEGIWEHEILHVSKVLTRCH